VRELEQVAASQGARDFRAAHNANPERGVRDDRGVGQLGSQCTERSLLIIGDSGIRRSHKAQATADIADSERDGATRALICPPPGHVIRRRSEDDRGRRKSPRQFCALVLVTLEDGRAEPSERGRAFDCGSTAEPPRLPATVDEARDRHDRAERREDEGERRLRHGPDDRGCGDGRNARDKRKGGA
jgi:hypothetical protein